MGSFPSILKFDSLEQQTKKYNNRKILLQQIKFKKFKKKIFFSKNKFNSIPTIVFKKMFYKNLFNVFYKIFFLIAELFNLNYNIFIIDDFININYLPIKNNFFNKKFLNKYKIIKFFNIKCIFYLNIKKKNINNILNFKLINISLNNKHKNIFDFSTNILKNNYNIYVFYIFFLKMYSKKHF